MFYSWNISRCCMAFKVSGSCQVDLIVFYICLGLNPWVSPEGVQIYTALEKYKNIAFPRNTVSDSLKNHLATKPAFIVVESLAGQQNAI